MEFGFTKEQERLRGEVHEFFINELPVDYRPCFEVGFSIDYRPRFALTKELLSFWLELQRKTGEKGYLTPGWSKESGGLGLSDIEQGIVSEETGYWGIFWPAENGVRICGPGLHIFGTEEQKRKFLPPIARGEDIWYQAFTEPEAGSDVANMQLRAVENGDDFILNGQKTFITGIAPADYLFTLVKTADTTPKHRGLSLLLIPARTPGITYRPLPTMSNFTFEIFFDDVRVPKEYLLGEINKGFYHAMTALEFERSYTGDPAGAKRSLELFVEFCRETKRNGKPLIEDPQVRDILAQMAVEAEVERLCAWHTAWYFSQRERLGPQPYDLSGLYAKTRCPIEAKAMMDMFGLYGQLQRDSKWVKYEGRVQTRWQSSRSTHPGGTIEINKYVIALRGLGLPRAPRPVAAKAEEKR